MITWEVMQKVLAKVTQPEPLDVKIADQMAKTLYTRMATILADVVEKKISAEKLTTEQRTAIAFLAGFPFDTRASDDGKGYVLCPKLPFAIFMRDGKYGVVCQQMPQHTD